MGTSPVWIRSGALCVSPVIPWMYVQPPLSTVSISFAAFGCTNEPRRCLSSSSIFKQPLKHILLYEKLTRFEEQCHKGKAVFEVRRLFPGAYRTHRTHKKCVKQLESLLRDIYGMTVTHVKAKSIELEVLKKSLSSWDCDAILSAGGDGTYLEAAALIPSGLSSHSLPLRIFGINTDPRRSEGRLCLSLQPFLGKSSCVSHREPHFSLGDGHSLTSPHDKSAYTNGTTALPPPESTPSSSQQHRGVYVHSRSLLSPKPSLRPKHSNQTKFIGSRQTLTSVVFHPLVCSPWKMILPHQRWLRKEWLSREISPRRQSEYKRNAKCRWNSTSTSFLDPEVYLPLLVQRLLCTCLSCDAPTIDSGEKQPDLCSKGFTPLFRQRLRVTLHDSWHHQDTIISHKAVNDVIIADRNSSRALYAEVQIDKGLKERQKSSGLLICTGTGSSAWAYNASKFTQEDIKSIVSCIFEEMGSSLPTRSHFEASKYTEMCNKINQSLLFHPSSHLMRYVVREPIENRVFKVSQPNGMAKKIIISPLSDSAYIYFDGITSVPLEVGKRAVIEIYPEDGIWTGK
ncbi:Dna-directed Rna polymerase III RPC8 [Cardiosporidium cionae]|uniref:Dna-directed Rna polymerase III RPC8 n=1 Tax=Cardiosporidium cionae TaxID=476202 RepID=A0ABQ7JBQ4_9APIC|nr:Dna-directed Rna polymerase III RPC8 [Cardiosporidium cionae]|eukprot:KAF8821438.1 Dna-directed Rna polymerase III RPC8 [Cardiosporidium cionae]